MFVDDNDDATDEEADDELVTNDTDAGITVPAENPL